MDHVEVKEKKIKRIIPILKTAINQVNWRTLLAYSKFMWNIRAMQIHR